MIANRPDGSTTEAARLASLQPLIVRRWLADNPQQRHRVVTGTVVSADISGFTRLAERLSELGVRQAAESLNETINRCFVPMIDEVLDRSGDVLKFGGDALFALFQGDDHQAQACMAAANMQRLLNTVDLGINITLSMTVGVASGEIPLSLAGAERRELVVHGAVVDECLRLESDAEPGEVLVATVTANAVPPGWIHEPEPGIRALVEAEVTDLPLPSSMAAAPDLEAVRWPEAVGDDLAAAFDSYDGTAGEVRVVTIAFVLLPIQGLDAEAVTVVVEQAMAVCRSYGVTFLSTDVAEGGLKILCSAGVPKATDGDEDAMLGAMSELVLAGDALSMRCGINRGLVYAGFLGSHRCQTFTVMGDSTNLAARLLGKAVDRSVAVSQAVLDHARAGYETVELAPVLVKGRIAPVTVHRLSASAPTVRLRAARPSFVGRTEELARLGQALSGARAGSGSVITVVGEAGVGASRLLGEFAEGLPDGVLQFLLSGQITLKRTPFGVMRSLLRSVAAIADDDEGRDAGRHLQAWVDRVAPDLSGWTSLVAPAFDADVAETAAVQSIGSEFRLDRANEVLAELLARALTIPAVVVVEDLQWVDQASLGLLRALCVGIGDRPWLLVASTRPGQEILSGERRSPDDQSAESEAGVITLAPLPVDDARAIIAEVGDLPDSRSLDVARRSGGNPLFAIELAQSVDGDDELFDSVEGLITARIDRLGHRERVLARTAAVLGQRFDLELLGKVLDLDTAMGDDSQPLSTPSSVAVDLQGLAQLIIDDGDGRAAFRSEVVREVAYRGLSGKRRRQLHGVVAKVLEAGDADIAELAWHHSRADNHVQSWTYNRRAAERAIRFGDMTEAAAHLERAVAAADAADPGAIEAAELTDALVESFDTAVSAERYEQALIAGERALDRIDDRLDRVRLLVRFASTRAEIDGSYAEETAILTEELQSCRSGSDDAEARAWLGATLAGLHYRFDTRDQAQAVAEAAVVDAGLVDELGPVPRALLIRHLVLSDRVDPGRLEAGAELIAAAAAADDLRILSSAHNNVGLDRQASGDWSAAAGNYEAAVKFADELGDRYRALPPAINRATLMVDRGYWDEARVALDEHRRTARHHRSGFLSAWVQRELGRLEVQAGRGSAARPWLEASLEWVTEAGITSNIYEVRLNLIAADLAEGRSSEVLDALTTVEDPSDLSSRQLGWRDTLAGYAYLQRGEPDVGLDHLERAVAATAERFAFGSALALVGRSEAEAFLGRGRAARATRQQADDILDRLGVVALPVIPLPK